MHKMIKYLFIQFSKATYTHSNRSIHPLAFVQVNISDRFQNTPLTYSEGVLRTLNRLLFWLKCSLMLNRALCLDQTSTDGLLDKSDNKLQSLFMGCWWSLRKLRLKTVHKSCPLVNDLFHTNDQAQTNHSLCSLHTLLGHLSTVNVFSMHFSWIPQTQSFDLLDFKFRLSVPIPYLQSIFL